MSRKRKLQIVIDLGMTLLLPLLMTYSLIGETAHEWLGTAMLLLFVAHHILNIQHGVSSAQVTHLLGAYWGFVLMSVHIGLHWSVMLGHMKKSMKKSMIESKWLKFFVRFLMDYAAMIVLFAAIG